MLFVVVLSIVGIVLGLILGAILGGMGCWRTGRWGAGLRWCLVGWLMFVALAIALAVLAVFSEGATDTPGLGGFLIAWIVLCATPAWAYGAWLGVYTSLLFVARPRQNGSPTGST